MSDNYKGLSLKYKMWISSFKGEDIMGNGKWLLLKTIDEEESLRAAADKLGVSYRKAWGGLKKSEEYLGVQLLHKSRGGANGGKTILTVEGREIVEAYEEFYLDMKKASSVAFDKFLKRMNK